MLQSIGLFLLILWPFITEAQSPGLIDKTKMDSDLEFCGEAVTRSQDTLERFEKEMLLALWDRPQVILWLKRAPRYFPIISRQLKKQGMPDDLKYLAIAESALRPHAGSSKGAVGFWQLLPQTARKYGLVVNEYIDQRREITASTNAALNYLQVMYAKFGSWTLAVAGYNMGEEGLAAEILEQNIKDYYKLYLPLETQRFIFRILSVKLIMQNPKAFGFDVQPGEQYAPIRFERIALDCFHDVPIRIIADAAGSHFKKIKDLNPHIRGHYLQEGHHQINLPVGSTEKFLERFQDLVNAYEKIRKQHIYIVQPGDSLSGIAEKFNVPLAALIIWNRLDLKRPIHPGERLVIHPKQFDQIVP
jgi:hypothetical protein